MTTWTPATTPPPAAGRYWTMTEISRATLKNNEEHITFTQCWQTWTGEAWEPERPSMWYGERVAK